MNGLAEAQCIYDRFLPSDIEMPDEPIDANILTEMFIEDFAATEQGAIEFLEDRGVHQVCGGAEVLQALCKTWIKDKSIVYAAAGVYFWQELKEMAFQAHHQQG